MPVGRASLHWVARIALTVECPEAEKLLPGGRLQSSPKASDADRITQDGKKNKVLLYASLSDTDSYDTASAASRILNHPVSIFSHADVLRDRSCTGTIAI